MRHPLKPTQKRMREIGLRPFVYNNIVVAAEAFDRGIEVTTVGRGTRLNLRHGNRRHFWTMGTNSLNSAFAIQCANHKDVTSRLLRTNGVNAPENAVFAADESKRAWAWAEPIAPVVVKPKDGIQGIGVYVDLDNWESFSTAFEAVAEMKGDVLVERFVPGKDHRVLVVDGEVVAVTHRIAANVVGDGSSSVAELIEEKNTHRRFIHKKLTVDEAVAQYVAKQGLSLASVPAKDQFVQLRGTCNVHTGGDATDATDTIAEEHLRMAVDAARAIPDLRIAGFDFQISDAGEASVLEVNSNSMISLHHFPWTGEPRDAASAVLNAMFPETARPTPTVTRHLTS